MKNRIDRREALRSLALFSTAALASALTACKSKPSCNDVSGLSPDDVNVRNSTAGYVPRTPDPAKTCSNCVHYVPAAPDACGGCKVVKGPIDPQAYCKLWMAKPA